MVQLTTIITLTTLLAFSSATEVKRSPAPGLQRTPVTPNTDVVLLKPRSLSERQDTCQGTCSACFGSGYTLCPSSTVICYKPGDPNYGLDSCTSSGSGSGTSSDETVSSSSAYPTSTGSAGDSNYCSGRSATCVSCFGEGYLQCSDGVNCYNPADPRYNECPDDSSSPSSTATGSSGSDDIFASLTSSLRTSSTRASTATSVSSPTSFSNSGSSGSGSSSGGSSSGAASSVDVNISKMAAVVLGGFGLFMLAL